jgi:hypothetical protein
VKPEEALAAARAAAARRRAAGDYAQEASPPPHPLAMAGEGVTLDRLLDWATIEPDLEELYSTRRFGAPVTFVKRGLARGVQQYLNQIIGQQSRFNVQLVVYVSQLADRVARLEEEAALRREGDAP